MKDISLCECVEMACNKTGLMTVEAATWMTPIIDANYDLGIDEIARRVRGKTTGTGNLFMASLTERGEEYGEVETAQIVVHWAVFTHHRLVNMADYKRFPDLSLRYSAVLDSCTCAAAKATNGQIFTQTDAPAIPLDGCDAKICRCNYTAGNEGWLRRLQGDTGG